jgi:chromosome condensin MukBEF ATPase and DNA-binding subunit MukB
MAKQQQQASDAWRKQARDLLQDEILGDELLLALHDAMETEEIDAPADLAIRLNLPVETIKNAKKKFRRAWERVIAIVGPRPDIAREAVHG